jgi:hypothetical protein
MADDTGGGPGMGGHGGFGSGLWAEVRAAGLVEVRLKTRSGFCHQAGSPGQGHEDQVFGDLSFLPAHQGV